MSTCTCSIRQGIMGGKCLSCGGQVVAEEVTPQPVDLGLLKTADYLKGLGPVASQHKLKDPMTHIVDDKVTMKCACDKIVKTLEMPQRHSGVVPYIDNICPGCEDQAKGLSPVVCATCHRVCGRLPPSKDQFGFKVEAGKHYHALECPICQPGKFLAGQVKSPIIEMLLFQQRMGVKS
jgi:hypothetical protein